ncbi:BQ5605_C003g02442 [Microbotryum silenes-dioicae]|uniref:Ribosome production factor 2 homolog n=1 Tax=Microbotryum silenes-dioicae TaxID=796604 RepID=A0A2X0M5Z5_9BASI|nr:BQ5605_C003g02442 [Microbotryum silenes-dioicae]
MSATTSAIPIIAPAKPKNARSKRAQQAREPQMIEKGAKTAMIVRGSSISEKVKVALSELNQLKKPHSISFSKPNQIRPFEDSSSLSFWSTKNDASLFLVGTHTKKRPHVLIWVRCFANEVMEMLEVGIEEVMPMSAFKGIKSTPGSTPLFHFASTSSHANLWESHPTFTQYKSLMLDFFRGVEMDGVALKGLERVISITIGHNTLDANTESLQDALNRESTQNKGQAALSSLLTSSSQAKSGTHDSEEDPTLPLIHFRTYTVKFLRSGVSTPLVALEPHGPHFTFRLRRSQLPSSEMWKLALKKAEPKSKTSKPKNKNIDIDEMGDKVGRVYVDKQDMGTLQARKFKGLKVEKKGKRAADNEGEAHGEEPEEEKSSNKRSRRSEAQE